MPVSEILKTLRQERDRLQQDLARITEAIEQLELFERGGRRPRGRPRRLPAVLDAEIAKKSA